MKRQGRKLREECIRAIHNVVKIQPQCLSLYKSHGMGGQSSGLCSLFNCIHSLGQQTQHQVDWVLQKFGDDIVHYLVGPAILGIEYVPVQMESYVIDGGEMIRLFVDPGRGVVSKSSVQTVLEGIRVLGSFLFHYMFDDESSYNGTSAEGLLTPLIEAFDAKLEDYILIDPSSILVITTFLSNLNQQGGDHRIFTFAERCCSRALVYTTSPTAMRQRRTELPFCRDHVISPLVNQGDMSSAPNWIHLIRPWEGLCRGIIPRELAAIFSTIWAEHESSKQIDLIAFAQVLLVCGHRQSRDLGQSYDVDGRICSLADAVVPFHRNRL